MQPLSAVCAHAVDRKKRRQKTKKRGRGRNGILLFRSSWCEEVKLQVGKKEEEEDARIKVEGEGK